MPLFTLRCEHRGYWADLNLQEKHYPIDDLHKKTLSSKGEKKQPNSLVHLAASDRGYWVGREIFLSPRSPCDYYVGVTGRLEKKILFS